MILAILQARFSSSRLPAKGLSLSKLALGYVMGIREIDQVLVGVNTVRQLESIVKATQIQIDPMDFFGNIVNDSNYVNPSNWN